MAVLKAFVDVAKPCNKASCDSHFTRLSPEPLFTSYLVRSGGMRAPWKVVWKTLLSCL